MKRNTLIITGMAFLVSIVAVSAFAHGPGWSRGKGYGNMMGPNCWGSGWHHKGGHGYSQEGYYGNLVKPALYALLEDDRPDRHGLGMVWRIKQKLNRLEAENERLRGLVRQAYFEGYASRDGAWLESKAHAALEKGITPRHR